MKSLLYILIITVQLLATEAFAQEVYKTVDEMGNIIYSDTPQGESEVVDTDLKNVHPPTKALPRTDSSSPSDKNVRYNIRLTTPQNNQQFGPQIKTIDIGVTLDSTLREGHSLAFYIDGKKVAQSSRALSTSVSITRQMRGQNSISAAIIDQNGKRLETSNTSIIHVIRAN